MFELNWSPEAIHGAEIDLNPAYQRDVVWTEDKQSALIDSLFRNFYIPPIILARRSNDEDDEEPFVCVDGKQRLTSLAKFMDATVSKHADSRNTLTNRAVP